MSKRQVVIEHIMNANVERDPDKPSPEEIAAFAEKAKDPKFWEACALAARHIKWFWPYK